MTKEQIFEMLRHVAEALGTSVEYLWEVVVRQVLVTGLQQGAWALLLALLAERTYRLGKSEFRRYNDAYMDPSHAYMDPGPFIVSFVVSGASALAGAILLTYAIGRMVNPEWYAIRLIRDLVMGSLGGGQ